jgi:hypothetical protein
MTRIVKTLRLSTSEKAIVMTEIAQVNGQDLVRITQTLVKKAKEKYGDIFPCVNKNDFSECLTEEIGSIILWFNTSDNSTHVLRHKLSKQK